MSTHRGSRGSPGSLGCWILRNANRLPCFTRTPHFGHEESCGLRLPSTSPPWGLCTRCSHCMESSTAHCPPLTSSATTTPLPADTPSPTARPQPVSLPLSLSALLLSWQCSLLYLVHTYFHFCLIWLEGLANCGPWATSEALPVFVKGAILGRHSRSCLHRLPCTAEPSCCDSVQDISSETEFGDLCV